MLSRIFIVLIAGMTGAYAIAALAMTRTVSAWSGYALTNTLAVSEFRAVYGGLLLVLAVGMIAAIRHPGKPEWIRFVGWIYIGLGLARSLALITEGFDPLVLGVVVGEIVVGWLLLLAGRAMAAEAE